MKNEKKRPFLLKLIIFSLVLIALMGWLRVYQSIYQWETLMKYGVNPGPWYSLMTGVVVGSIATIAAISSWMRISWSQLFVQISLIILSLGWWLDYLFFSQSSIAFYNLPFRLVANLIYLGFVIGYFFLIKNRLPKGHLNEE